jgi:hypothetical protein
MRTKFDTKWSVKICSDILEVDFSKEYQVAAVTHGNLKKLSLFCLKTKKVRWVVPVGVISVRFVTKWIYVKVISTSSWIAIDVLTGEVKKVPIRQNCRLMSDGELGAIFVLQGDDMKLIAEYRSFNPETGVVDSLDTTGAIAAYVSRKVGQMAVGDCGERGLVMGRLRPDGLIQEVGAIRLGRAAACWGDDEGLILQLREVHCVFRYFASDGHMINEFSVPTADYVLKCFFVPSELGGGFILIYPLKNCSGKLGEAEIARYDAEANLVLWRVRIGWDHGLFWHVGGHIVYAIGSRGISVPDLPGEGHDSMGSRQIDIATGEIGPFIHEPLLFYNCPTDRGFLFTSERRGWLSYGEFVSCDDDSTPVVARVTGDASEERQFHIPTGIVVEKDGEVHIQYKIYLEVASPERLREHLMTVLDLHRSNWTSTEFGGRVLLKCWNEKVSKKRCIGIERRLSEVVMIAQGLVDNHDIRSADGNRIVFEYSFSNTAAE